MATPHLTSPSKPAPAPAVAPPAPTKHPGDRLAEFFDAVFKTVTAISTLGASITFAKIEQTPVVPWVDYGFSKLAIQYYLADAFLFFVLDLFIVTLAATALSYWRPKAVDYFGTEDTHERRIVMWWATLVMTTLMGLLIAAFIFLALVMVGLTGPTGWISLGFTVFFGMVIIGIIVWKSPIGNGPPKAYRKHRNRLPRRQPPRYGSYYSSPDDEFAVGDYVSEEKLDVFIDGRGDEEYRYEEEEEVARQTGFIQGGRQAGYVDAGGYRDARAYADEPLSRSTTIARPTSAVVPPYTEEMRRMRHIKASQEYDGRYGN
jgi:hypothetical protein